MAKVPAWISASDECFLSGSPACHGADEYFHSRGLVSYAQIAQLWADGRGSNSDGAPLLALDGRLVFVSKRAVAVAGAAIGLFGFPGNLRSGQPFSRQNGGPGSMNIPPSWSSEVSLNEGKSLAFENTSQSGALDNVPKNNTLPANGVQPFRIVGANVTERFANLASSLDWYSVFLSPPSFVAFLLVGLGIQTIVVSSILAHKAKKIPSFGPDYQHCRESSLGAFIEHPCLLPARSCSTRHAESNAVLGELKSACESVPNPEAFAQQRRCAEALEHLSHREQDPRDPGSCELSPEATQDCKGYEKLTEAARAECVLFQTQQKPRAPTLYDAWNRGRRARASADRALVAYTEPGFTSALQRQVYRAAKLFGSAARVRAKEDSPPGAKVETPGANRRGYTRVELQRSREQAARLAIREATARKTLARSALQSAWSTLGRVPRRLFADEPLLQHFRTTFAKNMEELGKDPDLPCEGAL